jgi:hypothetical protein
MPKSNDSIYPWIDLLVYRTPGNAIKVSWCLMESDTQSTVGSIETDLGIVLDRALAEDMAETIVESLSNVLW